MNISFLLKENDCKVENRMVITMYGSNYEEDIISEVKTSEWKLHDDFEMPNEVSNRKEIALEDTISMTPYNEQMFYGVVYSEDDTSEITFDNVLEKKNLQYGILLTLTVYEYIVGSTYLPEDNHL